MGHWTDIEGCITVKPNLPQEFLDKVEECKKVQYLKDYDWNVKTAPVGSSYRNLGFWKEFQCPFSCPDAVKPASGGTWCNWEFAQCDGYTEIWNDVHQPYAYDRWLCILVRIISHLYPDVQFGGAVQCSGEYGDTEQLVVRFDEGNSHWTVLTSDLDKPKMLTYPWKKALEKGSRAFKHCDEEKFNDYGRITTIVNKEEQKKGTKRKYLDLICKKLDELEKRQQTLMQKMTSAIEDIEKGRRILDEVDNMITKRQRTE